MELLTIDYETFYDKGYSLSSMTTEEYIRGEFYETIMVSVQRNDEAPVWFSGPEHATAEWLRQWDWDNSAAIAHNAMFDMAILNWKHGLRPKMIIDTLSMLRAVDGPDAGNSLAKAAERHGLGVKGTEVVNALGKGRLDFNRAELERYAEYCMNDVGLTYALFHKLLPRMSSTEMHLIDRTIRMFSEPVLTLDTDILTTHLAKVKEKKERLLSKALVDKSEIMSNPKLAELLVACGVTPPVKVSPTTGKETYAFAKSDEEFKALLEHPHPIVQAIVAARLGVKSTLEETRTERLIGIAARGTLPIPLRYYAAHTGRWGGDDKVNMQNLPRKSPLKQAIRAPRGYLFCDCDSSQIEARTLAWIAGQTDLVEFFEKNNDEIANGVPKEEMQFDPYKIMASHVYSLPVRDISAEQRHVGKVTVLGCFAPDTLVLTARGWVSIVEVQVTDTVWDGEEWVTHQGVIPQGEKDVIRAWGVAATPDHEILTEHGWREWREVATDPFRFQSAIRKAISPFSAGTDGRAGEGVGSTNHEWNALVGGWDMWTDTTTSPGALPDAIRAPKKRRSVRASNTGGTPTSYQTSTTENGYSTGYRHASHDVTLPEVTLATNTTGIEASECTLHGEKIGVPSWPMSFSYRGGTTPSCSLTARITRKGTNPATCDSSPERPTWLTGEPSPPCRQKSMTYDIAYAGPRNRYTIATDAGPIIVHNCGYGLGWRKFVVYAKQQGIEVDDPFAKRIIDTYREAYPMIPQLWEDGNDALEALIDGYSIPLGRAGVLQVGDTTQPVPSIKLPNGLYLRYPNLRQVFDGETGRERIVYDTKRGASTIPKNIWGGSLTENFTQALARIIVGEQLLRVSKKYRVAMTVHDSIGALIPEGEAKEGRTYVEDCMRVRPKWATGLPLNCESKIGPSYG